MDINQFSAKLDSLAEPTHENMGSLAQWTESVALPWLWVEMAGAILEPKKKHELAKSAPPRLVLRPMNASLAVRHGLMVSLADRVSKPSEPLYFQAQLTMLDVEAKRHCAVIASWLDGADTPPPDAAVHTLHRALLEMMRYAHVLLEEAGAGVTDVAGYYRAGRNPFDSPFEVIQAARQIIYGAYSGLAFADRAPSVPVAVLRTAIELRLRDAFCVWGLTNLSDPTDMQPIDMSRLFEAIVPNEAKIEFAVSIHDVWKIYRWSNHYLHGGFRCFPWVPGFLLAYIWPLFTGDKHSSSMNAGIQMSEETWRSVRSSLAPKPPATFSERVRIAWSVLFPKAASRNMGIPPCDPRYAGFVLKN